MSIQQQIETRITEALSPTRLSVVNQSHMHNVPPGSESHFNAIIVAEAFSGQSPVARHRSVFAALGEVQQQIHAFTMKTLTPDEWQAAGGDVENPAPLCRGGSKT